MTETRNIFAAGVEERDDDDSSKQEKAVTNLSDIRFGAGREKMRSEEAHLLDLG